MEGFVTGAVFDLWTRWKDAEEPKSQSRAAQTSFSFEPEHVNANFREKSDSDKQSQDCRMAQLSFITGEKLRKHCMVSKKHPF